MVNTSGFFTPEILGFSLTPFSKETLGFLATHELLTIDVVEEHNSPETRRTLKFFVKLPSKLDSKFFTQVFETESKFYRDILPKLSNSSSWSPKCYLVKQGAIVLEDLRSQGFQSTNKLLNEHQLKSAVATLARFHASSMLLEKSLKKPLCEVFPELTKRKNLSDDDEEVLKWLKTGCEVVEAVAGKLNLDEKCAWPAYEIMIDSLKMKKGEVNVLGHNDLWFNNLMFNECGECRIVDFQLVSCVFYVIDLVQLVHLNASQEVRHKMERELIEVYHGELIKCLGEEILNLEDVSRDYEKYKICGLVFAAQYLPMTLLNKEMSERYVRDLEKHTYVSRKDFILDALQRDEYYRCRVEESVEELIGTKRCV